LVKESPAPVKPSDIWAICKRKYGYFCLPLLRGDNFVGRLDAKADRKSHELLIKSIHAEAGILDKKTLCQSGQKSWREFCDFNQCQRLILSESF